MTEHPTKPLRPGDSGPAAGTPNEGLQTPGAQGPGAQGPGAQGPAEPRQGARRYPRTFSGLIASMIVLVLAVVAYWVAQNLTQSPGSSTGPVDYRSEVAEIQAASGGPEQLNVVYPSSLPSSWTIDHADYTPGAEAAWHLGGYTDHNTFVGLVLTNDSSVQGLVKLYVDKDASSDGTVTMPSGVGNTWSAYSDAGGDHGYVMQLGQATLIVYGSGTKSDFSTFMAALTQAPINPSPSPSS